MVQPSLLDRLTDEQPQRRTDGQEERGFSLRRLRQAILRDVTWLLNAGNLAATTDLGPYPEVASSTLNFGVATLHGLGREGLDIDGVRQRIVTSLRRFEPRLLPATLTVAALDGREGLHFRIEADLWAEPMPLRMIMRTEVDGEVNSIRVVEMPQGDD